MTEGPKTKNAPVAPRQLRPKEAAPFFGQTARWVRDRMRDGSIKTVKVGPTEFIPIDELDRIYEGEGA